MKTEYCLYALGSFVRNEIQQQTKSAMLTFSYFKHKSSTVSSHFFKQKYSAMLLLILPLFPHNFFLIWTPKCNYHFPGLRLGAQFLTWALCKPSHDFFLFMNKRVNKNCFSRTMV